MGSPTIGCVRKPFHQSLFVTVFGQFLMMFFIITNKMGEKLDLILTMVLIQDWAFSMCLLVLYYISYR